MNYKLIIIIAFLAGSTMAYSQNPVMPTPAKDRDVNNTIRENGKVASEFAKYPIQNIGPTVMSGRVSDIEVNPNDPTEFYVAYASGGLWHTHNNGTSFTPIFDDQAVMTIGDIAVDWNSKTIYVGTGEVNSSRSSYAGNGIYKSTNGGETWIYLGLPESHHIGRVIIDPSDVNKVWVAVLGHLYSPNNERGIYHTADGGKTWEQTLFVNENTGAVDLVQDERKPNTLYAALWQRARSAWNFVEAGEGSGIYKSIDSGKTWKLISTAESGFPTGEGVGRIGLSLTYENEKPNLYVILDNYFRRPKTEENKKEELSKADFKKMDKTQLLDLPDSTLTQYLTDNNFPKKYDTKTVKSLVKNDEISPVALSNYLEDANSLLFDTDVIGAEVYKSTDNGNTFTKTHDGYIDRLYNSYGYYFGQIRVEPQNPNVVYIMGVPILRSDDGGVTWTNINGDNVHVDHHDLWINPNNTNHIINGNDGGVNISYDKGEHWIKCNSPAVGQFYYINVDNQSPYNVYAGAQDNGVWVGSSTYTANTRWHQTGQYPYEFLMGGDGMQVQIDSRDPNIIYTGFQFGNYFRINRQTGKRTYITPKPDLGERPYRWNWQSPILLSSHNQDILYMGANKLLRSMDKGEDFTEISEDLTLGGKKGDVAYGTIVSIDESIFTFGKIAVGTDDGKIQLTENGGSTWQDIGKNLPPHLWVSRVHFSKHDENTIYAALNGYRWDDFNAYLYKSVNNGKTWKDIAVTLPTDPINVIKEDPTVPDLLYVGTDHGLFVSTDGGMVFHRFASEMPNVPIHDLVVQEAQGHLLVGTHGRSIYKIDLNYLRELSKSDESITLFDLDNIKYRENWGKRSSVYADWREPTLAITVFADAEKVVNYNVQTKDGLVVYEGSIDLRKGINEFKYHLTISKDKVKKYQKSLKSNGAGNKDLEPKENGEIYLMKGEYVLSIGNEENEIQKAFRVE